MEMSILEKELIQKLNDDSIKVISFDIFDTLVFRKCQLPSTIFKVVGKNPIVKDVYDTAENFQKYRIYAERNARKKHEQFQDITLEQIYNELHLTETLKKQFQQLELEVEKEFLEPNNDLDRIIEQAVAKGKRVIFISDMYLSSEQLQTVCLYKLKSISKVSKVYVSSEYKLTKSKGDLFIKVLEEENIKPEQLLHIGDNPISDVLRAQELNIHNIYYGLSEFALNAEEYEQSYIKEQIEQGCHIRKLAALRSPYQDSLKSFYYNFGASIFGPALFEFSHWIHEQGTKRGVTEYNFFMREGYTFEKFFKKLYPKAKTNLIFASRASTSVSEMDGEDLISVILGTQRRYTIENLFDNLKIPNTNQNLIKYKDIQVLEAAQIAVNKSDLSKVLIADLTHRKSEIIEVITKEQNLIKDYFKSLGVDKNKMLIDFGAGGTILKRIKKILGEDMPNSNTLFYMNERGFKLQSELHTLSFLPYNHETFEMIESISRSPELYEILLNLDQATTTGYTKKKSEVVPLTYVPNCNIEKMAHIKQAFLLGITTFFNTAEEYRIPAGAFSKVFITKLLARVINLPTPHEVSFFKNLEIDEGNNSSHTYKILNQRQIEMIQDKGAAEMYFEFYRNLNRYRYLFPWFELSLTKVNPRFLFQKYETPDAESINKDVISQILDKIEQTQDKEFMIFGAGILFKELLPILKEKEIKILQVIDSRAELQEFNVLDYSVVSLDKAFKTTNQANIIIASGVFIEQIEEKINEFARLNNKRIRIFAKD